MKLMKKQVIIVGAAALMVGMFLGPQQDAEAGYLTDMRDSVVMNNYGECWQGMWPNPDQAPGCNGAMSFTLSSDNFAYDSAVLKPQMKTELDDIAAKINAASTSSVSVVGHTDSMGSDAYNQGLSERRAKSAARYLSGKGVGNISTSGMGEAQPVADNATAAGRAQNRRVVVSAE